METLSLDHQSLISPVWEKLCHDYDICFSEYSFANTYLFRKQHDYKIAFCETPCVRGSFKSGCHYFIPSVPPEKLKFNLPDDSSCFYPVLESWSQNFKSKGLVLKFDREQSDYIFSAHKLKTLEGNALSSRRNLLNQLESKYTLTSKTVDSHLTHELNKLLDTWQERSKYEKEKTDYYPCKEAIVLMDRLNLFGRVAFADDVPIGFTIGELLTRKTALLHFAKSLYEYKGVTPFLYKDFATHLPASVEWINLEQDLGIANLRQGKKAYDPDHILTKWKACLK